MKKIILIAAGLLLLAVPSRSQGMRSHNHMLNLNYLQLKEEMNHGLVFRGPGISYAFAMQWQNDRRIVSYENLLGFSYMQTRKVPAANLHIVPAKLCYLFKGTGGSNLAAGPFFMADYNYQFYPDLQSGQSYWMTHFSFGALLHYDLNIGRHMVSLSMSTSLFGFNSRQPEYYDPYFWDLSTADVLKYFHQDLTFASWNEYNFSEFEIRWKPSGNSRVIFACELEYTGYYSTPELSVVNQSFKLIFQPKSK